MKQKIRKNYFFVAANPLQILMSTSIMRQLDIADKSALIIHGGFAGAEEIAARLSPNDLGLDGLEIIYLNQRKDAFAFVNKAKPREIFIDGDVGFRNFAMLLFLKLFNRKLRISVFEEGIGTYRKDLYHGAKKNIFPTIGIGTHFGGSVLTSFVYAIDPSRYKNIFPKNSAIIRPIDAGPRMVLWSNYHAWVRIFNYKEIEKTSSNECNVYLTNWNFRVESLKRIFELKGDHYIKLHPRCGAKVSMPGVVVFDTAAPAEMILSDLANKYKIVRVFHHGSSVAQYFSDSNVIFIQL